MFNDGTEKPITCRVKLCSITENIFIQKKIIGHGWLLIYLLSFPFCFRGPKTLPPIGGNLTFCVKINRDSETRIDRQYLVLLKKNC